MKFEPQLRIESDGTPHGTKVVLIKSGEEIRNVTSIKWSLDMDGISLAEISLFGVALSGEAIGSDERGHS